MKDLLLVSLRDPYMESDRVMPPLGIMSLHAYIKRAGFDVDMTNDVSHMNLEELGTYKYVGISCMTPQKTQAEDILKTINAKCPNTQVILGGPHVDFYLQECMDKPYDHVVQGDGEQVLEQILKGAEVTTYKPSCWQALDPSLADLPLPTRTKHFLKDYSFSIQGLDSTTILTAKGCPNSCGFCEAAKSKVRLFPVEHIDRQIRQCLDLGYQAIQFYDDLFAMSLKRVKELCQIIKPYGIKFRCCGHARTLTEEMADILADAGCIEMSYGAETGSQEILDTVNKKTTVEQNHQFYEICNSRGIKAKAFMIVGLPGESLDSLEDTSQFLKQFMSKTFINHQGRKITNDFDVSIYYPYKGTHIRDHMQEYDIQIDTTNTTGHFKGKGGLSECAVRTSELSERDIQIAQKTLLETYKTRAVL